MLLSHAATNLACVGSNPFGSYRFVLFPDKYSEFRLVLPRQDSAWKLSGRRACDAGMVGVAAVFDFGDLEEGTRRSALRNRWRHRGDRNSNDAMRMGTS